MKATHPGSLAAEDDDFTDGKGSDTTTYRIALPPEANISRLAVKATVYYQATPPYYLANLFKTAPNGEATQRLHAIASRVDLKGTAIADWKLPVVSATVKMRSIQ